LDVIIGFWISEAGLQSFNKIIFIMNPSVIEFYSPSQHSGYVGRYRPLQS
jgi:hypothetical protein